jgi:hypothetical protein
MPIALCKLLLRQLVKSTANDGLCTAYKLA